MKLWVHRVHVGLSNECLSANVGTDRQRENSAKRIILLTRMSV